MKLALSTLGAGIIILGAAGLNSTLWLALVDVLLGIASLIIAAVSDFAPTPDGAHIKGALALASAAAVTFIVATALDASSWLAWWTLAFGVAFLVASGEPRAIRPSPPGQNEER